MAKGNMFQGMSRGKVGDVVFSRLNGQQISRVRNRYPKNPKTNAQLYQRAVMATVMRAYSAGIEIFDHAFQGKTKGAANQRYFISENAKLLRGLISAKLSDPTNAAAAFVNAPSTLFAVPNAYKVSEGRLNQPVFNADGSMVAALANETIAQYCTRLGIVANDIYTLVMIQQGGNEVFKVASAGDAYGGTQKESEFIFLRFFVKASALTDTTVITNATTKAAFFTLDAASSQYGTPLETTMATAPIIDDELPYEGAVYSSAVIRSRVNEDLRSTTYMTLTEWASERAGISAQYALAAWKQGTEKLGASDLILEGGDV